LAELLLEPGEGIGRKLRLELADTRFPAIHPRVVMSPVKAPGIVL